MSLLKVLLELLSGLFILLLLCMIHVGISIFLYFNYGVLCTIAYQIIAIFVYLIIEMKIPFWGDYFTTFTGRCRINNIWNNGGFKYPAPRCFCNARSPKLRKYFIWGQGLLTIIWIGIPSYFTSIQADTQSGARLGIIYIAALVGWIISLFILGHYITKCDKKFE